MPTHHRIAIIGAGPFGLALAARLQAAHADFVLYGRVMSFWRENVAQGTQLLTHSKRCSFAHNDFDVDGYGKSLGARVPDWMGADQFVDYGLWFYRNACPQADERTVTHVTRADKQFKIVAEDGSETLVDHLILAVGLKSFARRPAEFASLPRDRVFHTCDFHDLSQFRRKSVAVIGGGQSAIDVSALLLEQDASVEVIAQAPGLFWLCPESPSQTAGIFKDHSNWRSSVRSFINRPDVFRRIPAPLRARWLRRELRPAASSDRKPRISRARLSFGRTVREAQLAGDQVRLRLDDGTARNVDCVILGTGYQVAVENIPFLPPELTGKIKQHQGYPELNSSMECSVPSLYFSGATAAWNFGPSMWFVRGVPWVAERIVQALARKGALATARLASGAVTMATERSS